MDAVIHLFVAVATPVLVYCAIRGGYQVGYQQGRDGEAPIWRSANPKRIHQPPAVHKAAD